MPVEQIAEALMGDHRPFGPASRPGCVDYVGQVLRLHTALELAASFLGDQLPIAIQAQDEHLTVDQLLQ